MMRDLPTRWGLSLPNRGVLFGLTTVDDLFASAALAEESGAFESVWVGDSFIHKPRLDSIVMLSNLAARTERVRLGTICMATFPLRHPVELAIQWASLDHVSGGRTVLGACIGGGHEAELRAFGQTSRERVPRLEEGVALLRALWGGERVHHRGRFYTLEDYDILPKPVQNPCPIWIAVNPRQPMAEGQLVKRALERAVRLGDGYMTDAVAPDEFRRRWEFMQETAERLGRDLSRFETCIHGMININEDKQAALRGVAALLSRVLHAVVAHRRRHQDLARSRAPGRVRRAAQGMAGHGHHHAGAALHRTRPAGADTPFRDGGSTVGVGAGFKPARPSNCRALRARAGLKPAPTLRGHALPATNGRAHLAAQRYHRGHQEAVR